jgi:hypothetical protein
VAAGDHLAVAQDESADGHVVVAESLGGLVERHGHRRVEIHERRRYRLDY